MAPVIFLAESGMKFRGFCIAACVLAVSAISCLGGPGSTETWPSDYFAHEGCYWWGDADGESIAWLELKGGWLRTPVCSGGGKLNAGGPMVEVMFNRVSGLDQGLGFWDCSVPRGECVGDALLQLEIRAVGLDTVTVWGPVIDDVGSLQSGGLFLIGVYPCFWNGTEEWGKAGCVSMHFEVNPERRRGERRSLLPLDEFCGPVQDWTVVEEFWVRFPSENVGDGGCFQGGPGVGQEASADIFLQGLSGALGCDDALGGDPSCYLRAVVQMEVQGRGLDGLHLGVRNGAFPYDSLKSGVLFAERRSCGSRFRVGNRDSACGKFEVVVRTVQE